MPRSTNLMIGAALTVAATLGLPGCSSKPTVQWSADGTAIQPDLEKIWWQEQVAYFPQSQVYFDHRTQNYYWIENSAWQEGPRLPKTISLRHQHPDFVKRSHMVTSSNHDTVVIAFQPPFEVDQTPLDEEPMVQVDDSEMFNNGGDSSGGDM